MANGRIDYSVKVCAIDKIMCSCLAFKDSETILNGTHMGQTSEMIHFHLWKGPYQPQIGFPTLFKFKGFNF